jgi:D-glycero-D-manno-heptose 1,7-bisphosphate phosphatase
VILDRDGVINQDSDEFIKTPEEWIPIAGSLEAIERLNHNGFKVVVISNQSGIARGLLDIDDLNAIHQKMYKELDRVGGQIECVLFCPHGPNEGCNCRKPKIGLFTELESRLGTRLENVPVIGDSFRDIQAAQDAGALPILVKTGKGKDTFKKRLDDLHGVQIFKDLAAAVESIVIRQ